MHKVESAAGVPKMRPRSSCQLAPDQLRCLRAHSIPPAATLSASAPRFPLQLAAVPWPEDHGACIGLQVAGFKYFRLYALDQTPKLYARTQRGNNKNSFGTSPVRVEAPIPPEHALFEGAEYVEGILEPGDV